MYFARTGCLFAVVYSAKFVVLFWLRFQISNEHDKRTPCNIWIHWLRVYRLYLLTLNDAHVVRTTNLSPSLIHSFGYRAFGCEVDTKPRIEKLFCCCIWSPRQNYWSATEFRPLRGRERMANNERERKLLLLTDSVVVRRHCYRQFLLLIHAIAWFLFALRVNVVCVGRGVWSGKKRFFMAFNLAHHICGCRIQFIPPASDAAATNFH